MSISKRPSSKEHGKEASKTEMAAVLRRMIENETSTFEMQKSAKAEAGPAVMLTPTVPLTTSKATGWFGGSPRLPKEVPWPEIDGTRLCFVAQIDLSRVPQNIWSGLGPRRGHFVFFIHPKATGAKVLHVDGELEQRLGPSPVDAYWWR